MDNKLALVQVMAQHWIGDKPLLEPMMTRIYVITWYHKATMSQGWDKYWTYEYECWKFVTWVVLKFLVYSYLSFGERLVLTQPCSELHRETV